LSLTLTYLKENPVTSTYNVIVTTGIVNKHITNHVYCNYLIICVIMYSKEIKMGKHIKYIICLKITCIVSFILETYGSV